MNLTLKKQIEFDLTIFSLISKKITILNSKNKNQINLSGIILKETANFLFIKSNENTIKQISKNNLIIEFEYNQKKVNFNCNAIKGTIQQRLKKLK